MGRKNGGWGGDTSFEFEIERYKRFSDGVLFTVDAPEVRAAEGLEDGDTAEWAYQLIELKVSGSAYFEPGKYYGPPEDSYPDEGGCEIEDVVGPDDEEWQDRLTTSEVKSIEAQIEERCQEGGDDGPDTDDYPDDYYDDHRFEREEAYDF